MRRDETTSIRTGPESRISTTQSFHLVQTPTKWGYHQLFIRLILAVERLKSAASKERAHRATLAAVPEN
jgi:hypothetical protein